MNKMEDVVTNETQEHLISQNYIKQQIKHRRLILRLYIKSPQCSNAVMFCQCDDSYKQLPEKLTITMSLRPNIWCW